MARTSTSRRTIRGSASTVPSVPAGNWVVDSIRLSLFLSNVGALNLPSWQAITGSPPQITASNTPIGMKQEAGPLPLHPHVQMGLLEQPGRADLMLNPVISPSVTAKIFSLGAMDDALKVMDPISAQWIPQTQDIARLAMGATLIWESPDSASAIAVLLHHVKAFVPKGTIEDFTLQINRPRLSSVRSGLRINRLTHWWTAVIGPMPMFQGPVFAGGQPLATLPTFSAGLSFSGLPVAVCTVDINTDPNTPVSAAEISPVLAEMRSFVAEIAKKGDTQ